MLLRQYVEPSGFRTLWLGTSENFVSVWNAAVDFLNTTRFMGVVEDEERYLALARRQSDLLNWVEDVKKKVESNPAFRGVNVGLARQSFDKAKKTVEQVGGLDVYPVTLDESLNEQIRKLERIVEISSILLAKKYVPQRWGRATYTYTFFSTHTAGPRRFIEVHLVYELPVEQFDLLSGGGQDRPGRIGNIVEAVMRRKNRDYANFIYDLTNAAAENNMQVHGHVRPELIRRPKEAGFKLFAYDKDYYGGEGYASWKGQAAGANLLKFSGDGKLPLDWTSLEDRDIINTMVASLSDYTSSKGRKAGKQLTIKQSISKKSFKEKFRKGKF